LKDGGYFTANITHIGEREVGTGKLDLNFVNVGVLCDDSSAVHTFCILHRQDNLPEVRNPSAGESRIPLNQDIPEGVEEEWQGHCARLYSWRQVR
jgi:hypothetical protein